MRNKTSKNFFKKVLTKVALCDNIIQGLEKFQKSAVLYLYFCALLQKIKKISFLIDKIKALCYNYTIRIYVLWVNYVYRRISKLKTKYVRPEYEINNQLADVILVSIQEDLDNQTITGIVDIEDLFG